MATIDRHYFRVCMGGALRRGLTAAALLAEAGIDPDLLDRPGWRGTTAQMVVLVRAIWRELGDEFMGHTEAAMAPGSLAFAFELAREAETVAQGLARAARFYNLAGRGIATRIEALPEGLAATIDFARPELDPEHYFNEFWMITWHRLACWLAGETLPLVSATFDYPRPDAYFEEFRHLFPCPHRFDAGCRRIVIDPHVLHAPVRRTLAELHEMIATAPREIMTIPASDHSLGRAVRQLLSRRIDLSAAAVARDLRLSPERLRRALRAEGTSLSGLREEVRRDKASRRLLTTTHSVEAIAAELGYAEARSFTRAFRQWTGQSPLAFRRKAGTVATN